MLGIFETFIFLCIFGYLLNKARGKDMVVVLNNYVQDAISVVRLHRRPSNEDGTLHNPDERPTAFGLKRNATEKIRLRNEQQFHEKQFNDRQLYQIKESPLPNLLPYSSKQITRLACKYCVPSKAEQQLCPELNQTDVINLLHVGTYNKARSIDANSFFKWNTWFPVLMHCLRLKRYPYPQVTDGVMKDERLKSAINMSVEKTIDEKRNSKTTDEFNEDEIYEKVLKEHKNRTQMLLLDMRSKISDFLLRFATLVLFKLLPSFMSGVVAPPAQIAMLKKAATDSPNVPLIFLPLHRSHLDYILVSFILYCNEIRAPIVAAGDNLRIPFFGALLRGLGAFFIKRKIDPVAGRKDIVYRAVLHTYIQHALAAGHNLEFFIEGGRTRTGKPMTPKSGVLSVIIDAFMDGTIKDALLVPVSLNYERLADGNFVYEQLGQKKKPETFASAASAIWNILNSKYGQMRIDFNEPFSLKELVKSFEKITEPTESLQRQMSIENGIGNAPNPGSRRLKHQPSTSSLYGTDVVDEEHRTLVDSIARHVVYDCSNATAVMTTNAVSFLLLTRFRDGATINVLADALDELREILRGVRAISFTGESHDIITYVADLLGPSLIKPEKRNGQQFFKPVSNVRSLIELSYYSNSLVAHFALDSVVISTLVKLIEQHSKTDSNTALSVSKEELFRACIEYCDILRYEFLFNKPCQKLTDLLNESCERLKERELISYPSENLTTEQVRAIRYYNTFEIDSDDGYDYAVVQPVTKITLPSKGHEQRLVLTSVITPYAHTYMAVVRSLPHLRDYGMMEIEFVRTCVTEITRKVDSFECKYGESISTDTIRNCMKVLEKCGYIQITNVNGARVVSLHKKYDNDDGVQQITKRIESIVTI